MSRIKRTSFAFFAIDDAPVIDFASLLRGQAAVEMVKSVYALSLLCGKEFTISLDELKLLFALPSDEWVLVSRAMDEFSIDAETLGRFAHQGLIITDEDHEFLSQLRTREERLSASQWHPYAALYHFLTKWQDVNVNARFPDTPEEWQAAQGELDSAYQQFIHKFGKPPPAFVQASSEDLVPLPLARKSEGVFELLMKRRTTRAFDRATPLGLDNLSATQQRPTNGPAWSVAAGHQPSAKHGRLRLVVAPDEVPGTIWPATLRDQRPPGPALKAPAAPDDPGPARMSEPPMRIAVAMGGKDVPAATRAGSSWRSA